MSMPTKEPWYAKYYIIDENGCWHWRGRINNLGYGDIYHNKKHYKAHRLFWELHKDEIPEGIFVLHKCDVRDCVNPDHLFLGTQQDNVADMIAKGRKVALSGRQNGRAILSESDVIEIFQMLKDDLFTPLEIADMYGVSRSSIYYIRKKGWRHLKGDVE